MSSSHAKFDHVFKVILVGDTRTGKTQIRNRFAKDFFKDNDESTIGVNFDAKEYFVANNNKKIRLQLWDTAGRERFRTVTLSYFRTAAAFVLMFDITNKDTFNNINRWFDDINRFSKTRSDEDSIPIILIGNQSDLEGKRQVAKQEAEDFAQQNGFIYHEVSAKTGEGVHDVFQTLAEQLYDALPEDEKIKKPVNSQSNATENHPIENTPTEKKPGFFTWLWNVIKEFFTWLCCFPIARTIEQEALLGDGYPSNIGAPESSDSFGSSQSTNLNAADAKVQYTLPPPKHDPRHFGRPQTPPISEAPKAQPSSPAPGSNNA